MPRLTSGLSDVNCVKGEVHNVLTVMRLNSRWASADRFKMEVRASANLIGIVFAHYVLCLGAVFFQKLKARVYTHS